MNPVGRQCRVQRGRELAHGVNRHGIGVHRPHIELAAQEIRKIAPGAAAGIHHARTTVETAAKELIEQVDVDPAELRFQFG